MQNVPHFRLSRLTMKEAGDRLRELRIRKGYGSAVDCARAFGWNENTYKSHENGERGIKPAVAKKYAAALGSTAGYILTGGKEVPVIERISSVPVVGIVAAGVFRTSDSWGKDMDAMVPAMERPGIPAYRQYAVKVDGPSVNKRIPDGMFAICAMFDSYPGGAHTGSLVHVIRTRGGEVEHTLKEVRFTKAGTMLFPVSDHPDHQEAIPYVSSDTEIVQIHGIVIGAFLPL